jgi:hypothetical protein
MFGIHIDVPSVKYHSVEIEYIGGMFINDPPFFFVVPECNEFSIVNIDT